MRTGGGEGDAHAAGGLDDPAGDLEQVQPERGELGGGQLVRPGDAVAQGQQQPVGGGVQDKADLVGERQEVRSEASWALCSFTRFSACPLAQYRLS